MSIQGRTSERWGRDKSARWDPGPTNRFRSYPAVEKTEAPVLEHNRVDLPNRPGAAERHMTIEHRDGTLTVSLHGWAFDHMDLNERQAVFLRDTLAEWFPRPSSPTSPP